MTSSLWKGVVKAADRLSGKIPESGPELVAYMTRKDLETKVDGRKTWKSWNNYTLTQLARELAKESRYSKYQKKECYEQLIHRLLDFRFFAHMLKAIMVVEEELLLDFRESAYVLQLFSDTEIPPHIIEKEVQHPRFKERLQRKDKITLKDLIAHLQNVNYKIWVDDHQEDWGHAIRKRARRIYKYLDDPEELAIARAKAQGKPIPKRSKPKPSAKSSSASKSKTQSKSSSKTATHTSSKKKSNASNSQRSAQKTASRSKASSKPANSGSSQKSQGQGQAQAKRQVKSSGKQEQGDDFDLFGDAFNSNEKQVGANEDPSLGWLAGLDSSNLQNMSGFDVETGAGAGADNANVEFGFGNFDDEKNDFTDEDDENESQDEDFENMFDKLAKHTDANILDTQKKKPQNKKNTKGKTMSQMATQKQHTGDLNQAMAPSNDFGNIKDPFATSNTGSDPFADMNAQQAQQQRMQQNQINSAFSQFGNFGQGGGGGGGAAAFGASNGFGGMNSMNSMNNNGYSNNNNNNGAMGSPTDLFTQSAKDPSSIFGQPNDPFANLSAQYSKSGNAAVASTVTYGARPKQKDAFSDLNVLK